MPHRRARWFAATLSLMFGCARPEEGAPVAPAPSPSALAPRHVPALEIAVAPAATASPRPAPVYPWLADPTCRAPAVVDALEDRFAPPAGFARDPVTPRSFGAWLRRLPLAAPGTPVVSHRGAVILPPDHPNLAAVVAIDVGSRDLQQCADSILRLHAEWQYAEGRRDLTYRAANRSQIPFARWARGERTVAEGAGFSWTTSGRADDSHASLRGWLDAVFMYANTGSLARDTDRVALADLRPGDFVVQPGAPGHAVLVLDVARAADGRRALLLGQGFMPAQSFQVLERAGPRRHGRGRDPWFIVEVGDLALDTPFWAPFPWSALRRFPGA